MKETIKAALAPFVGRYLLSDSSFSFSDWIEKELEIAYDKEDDDAVEKYFYVQEYLNFADFLMKYLQVNTLADEIIRENGVELILRHFEDIGYRSPLGWWTDPCLNMIATALNLNPVKIKGTIRKKYMEEWDKIASQNASSGIRVTVHLPGYFIFESAVSVPVEQAELLYTFVVENDNKAQNEYVLALKSADNDHPYKEQLVRAMEVILEQ